MPHCRQCNTGHCLPNNDRWMIPELDGQSIPIYPNLFDTGQSAAWSPHNAWSLQTLHVVERLTLICKQFHIEMYQIERRITKFRIAWRIRWMKPKRAIVWRLDFMEETKSHRLIDLATETYPLESIHWNHQAGPSSLIQAERSSWDIRLRHPTETTEAAD